MNLHIILLLKAIKDIVHKFKMKNLDMRALDCMLYKS